MDFSAMSKRFISGNVTTNDTNNFDSPFSFNNAGWILNLVVVFPENIYVIWLIVTGAGNGVAAEFFSLNLYVCEIFICLQSFLSLLSSTFPSVNFVVLFLTGVSITGRPLFQCLICAECYLAVVHPFTFLKFKSLQYKMICCNSVWLMIILSCVFASVKIIANQIYVFMCYSLCQALLALSVKLFCCLAVLRALKQSGPGERGKDKVKENHIKRKAFHVILMIIMGTVLTYAAYMTATLMYILANEFISMLWTASHVSFLLAGLVQPLIYLQRTGKLPFCKTP